MLSDFLPPKVLPKTPSHLQAFIGLGLSIGKSTEKGHADYGTLGGVNHSTAASPAETSWNVFVALGSVAFAYSFVSLIQWPSVSP